MESEEEGVRLMLEGRGGVFLGGACKHQCLKA